jgi:hypothetical protein
MANTTKEYLELQKFFTTVKLPESITLEPGTTIPDVTKFVENNMKVLGTGEMGEVAAAGRYYRMKKLMTLLSA